MKKLQVSVLPILPFLPLLYKEIFLSKDISIFDTWGKVDLCWFSVFAAMAGTAAAPTPAQKQAETQKPAPGFEAAFAIAGLLAIAYLLRRIRTWFFIICNKLSPDRYAKTFLAFNLIAKFDWLCMCCTYI